MITLAPRPRLAVCDMYPRPRVEPRIDPVRSDGFDSPVRPSPLDLGALSRELCGLRSSFDGARSLLARDLRTDYRGQLSAALRQTPVDAFSGPDASAPFAELKLPRDGEPAGHLVAGPLKTSKTKAPKQKAPSFWKKVMWWGIADLGVSLLDYVGYNLLKPKQEDLAKDPNAKVSPWYRVFQGAVQGFTGSLLAKHLGPGTAAAFAISQWTAGNDFLYYGWGALADRLGIRPEGWDGGAGNLLNEKPDWFNWTPQGLLFGETGPDGKRRVDGSIVAAGSLLGVPLSLALMAPDGGLLGTPVKDRKGWLADLLNTIVP